MPTVGEQITAAWPLVVECMATGDVLALFPLLRDWNVEKLKQLRMEVADFHKNTSAGIQKGWGELALMPENFLSASRQKLVDEARDHAEMDLMICCSEILSVAEFYLQEKGIPDA